MSEQQQQEKGPETPAQEPMTEPVEMEQASPETLRTDVPLGAEAQTGDDVERQLQEANAKAQEHLDKLMRVVAEMDNLRKRHERDLESAHKFALDGFAKELLQVRDSLELGYQAAQDEQAQVQTLREGTELTLKLMADVMQKFGIEQIDPIGQPFNPEQHQAMQMMPSAEHEPNSVVQVVQKGYLLNGRMLRPAMVIVSANA
ncbi:MAG: nucleotide exchange factor GrpE [Gammaproteobacteria bacterium SHHR-1]|uniref:nucleotide exchange factor GrpE n=1 Tax=Magnetovirga frankeli TaxID=947516 RepID=UPI001293624B|nr:nucleotide exchange factor GrpE [gamma proteobacterium SS-5]